MKFINLHTHHFSNNTDIIEIVNQYPWEFNENVPFFSVGIHPWHIKEDSLIAELKFINRKIEDPKCLALGECGLDKRTEIAFDLQLAAFEKQLLLAQDYKKPVIVHCVGAFNEVIAIKKRLKINVPMVAHGFSKNENVATSLIDNGFYLSFGKYLMLNPSLETVFLTIPIDKIFLETDSSEFKIEDVYKKAASIKGISINQLQYLIRKNFETVFSTRNEI